LTIPIARTLHSGHDSYIRWAGVWGRQPPQFKTQEEEPEWSFIAMPVKAEPEHDAMAQTMAVSKHLPLISITRPVDFISGRAVE